MGCIDIRAFFSRLARDARGNTIAIMAAALLPLAGLIGGGVDMSRLYLTKTRLQQACDAGALAGRKAMAGGAWYARTAAAPNNDENSDEAKAEAMFSANFTAGQYGTGTVTKNFSSPADNNGTVNGTATVRVPMTIMKVFGMDTRSITVNCTATMQLPNTDVMFVLDTTLSMGCLPSATNDQCSAAPSGQARMDGLKKAVKCFYEALERVSTPEPCTFVSGTTYNSSGDPTATTASTTAQVRIGFVPYGVNVNVGKLLPNSMIANNWVYQSRVATVGTDHAWTLGAESPAQNAINNWGAWSNPPNNLGTPSSYGTGYTLTSGAVTINGTSYPRYNTTTSQTTCTGLNNASGWVGYVDTPSVQNPALQSTTHNPPVWTNATTYDTSQTLTYSQSDNHTARAYKYVWVSGATSGQKCQLQQSNNTVTYTLTRNNGTTTKAITWSTPYNNAILGWTYKPVRQDVSGLKAGGSSWNNTVSLPIGQTSSGSNYTFSGESTARKATFVSNVSVTWDGCVEEAQTFENIDNNPSDDWTTIPASAYDMNINLIPNSPSTDTWLTDSTHFGPGSYWGPLLAKTSSSTSTINSPVWARYTGGSSSNWTQSDVPALPTDTSLSQNNYTYVCTTLAAKKLTEYRTNTNFLTFVNALTPTDAGTYHDIGMLWGARLLSPTGIFAAENATAASGGAIQRHLIFMTDGVAHSVQLNYTAYGLNFFNRYQFQTEPSCSGSPAVCANTDALINARLVALCNEVRNMNITLWVVSYGNSIDTTTHDRLQSCATDPQHFFSATDTPTLIANFQTIANKISALRLTN